MQNNFKSVDDLFKVKRISKAIRSNNCPKPSQTSPKPIHSNIPKPYKTNTCNKEEYLKSIKDHNKSLAKYLNKYKLSNINFNASRKSLNKVAKCYQKSPKNNINKNLPFTNKNKETLSNLNRKISPKKKFSAEKVKRELNGNLTVNEKFRFGRDCMKKSNVFERLYNDNEVCG